jgi:hypothetical protein
VARRGSLESDERSARPYVLAHLLIVVLLEPLVDELNHPGATNP